MKDHGLTDDPGTEAKLEEKSVKELRDEEETVK